ncbi:ribbon-helix-helix domain-containing protein [Clostridium estertheticum]|uniref:ribbon-helix-helix domain-containing protein n=1 Tax=Clostridium estertheticum TaxID=238834 RepID=UPI0013EE95A7|nr:ribbon-helix-helix domain-containing protein [Clostridium estertheticum]MBZ9606733.1 ribbon-helix-helix domain-containing protein [Clostridium estertheticum]
MARTDLKTRTPLGNAIKTELYKQLKTYSKETSIPMSKLLDKAIELLLKSTEK